MQFSITFRSVLRRGSPSTSRIVDWNIIQYCRRIVNQRQPFASFSNESDHEQDTVSVPDSSNILDRLKKPPTIFLRYIKLVQPEIIRQFPQAKRSEIIKIASERYKCVDKKILTNLRIEHEKDLETYEKLVKVFQQEEPIKPATVFFRFVKLIEPAIIREFSDATKSEILTIASEKYSNADKKLLYILRDEYRKEKKQYNKEVEKYESKLNEEKNSRTKNQRIKYDLQKSVRQKRPVNAYLSFLRNKRLEQNRPVKIANEGNELPKEEKSKRTAEVEKQSDKFQVQKTRLEKKNEIMREYGVFTRKGF